MATAAGTIGSERQWYIASRWQEFEGESRANLLRLLAIGAFYVVQLWHFYIFSRSDVQQLPFHQRATAIAVAWTMVALAVMLCQRMRVFPAALKYVSTACDLILLTALATLAAGPFSPLVFVYFVIVALAALRFSLSLVWFATLGSMTGYWGLVGAADKTWFNDEHVVPLTTQMIVLLSLGLTGVVLGQVVRRVKALAADYAQRLGTRKAA
jgi:hypothetical protein